MVTGGSREKPQGLGLFFLLGSSEISGKKPHPSGAFRKNPLYIIENTRNTGVFREKPQGGGAFFLLDLSEISEKKPHPPGAFHENPLYIISLKIPYRFTIEL